LNEIKEKIEETGRHGRKVSTYWTSVRKQEGTANSKRGH
jgi:hypothetical protein